MQEAMIKTAEIEKRLEHPKDPELPTLDAMRCAMAEHEVLMTEEDKLYESEPDEKGIRYWDSTCFHCSQKVHLETNPDGDEEYFIYAWKEQEKF